MKKIHMNYVSTKPVEEDIDEYRMRVLEKKKKR
jgi:hypothetical protein